MWTFLIFQAEFIGVCAIYNSKRPAAKASQAGKLGDEDLALPYRVLQCPGLGIEFELATIYFTPELQHRSGHKAEAKWCGLQEKLAEPSVLEPILRLQTFLGGCRERWRRLDLRAGSLL